MTRSFFFFFSEGLPIPYLNADGICDPLGDLTVWGSLYNLVSSNYTNEVIMLAAKVSDVYVLLVTIKLSFAFMFCFYVLSWIVFHSFLMSYPMEQVVKLQQ